MKKYLNEAIIGNKNVLATLSSKGEFLRISYPSRDNRQYLNFLHMGLKINDSDIIYLHDDINNAYKQYYDTDTNVLNTEIINTYFKIKMVQTDFAMLKEDVIVRKCTIINENNIDLDLNLLIHSELLSDYNNFVGAKAVDNGILQYAHDFSMSIFAKNIEVNSYQLHNSKENIRTGVIGGKDYIGMTKDSSIDYTLGTIKSGEKKEFVICIMINDNKNTICEVENEIERIKKIDFNKEYTQTKSYWRKYVKAHDGLNLEEPKTEYEEKILEIYIRSILLFPLLTNQTTGGIIAAPEVDEDLSHCGRYAYCWPRDAVFITRALDVLKMEKEAEKFYSVFCKKTQSKNGMWEQRFYTDGRLAPCWGYQIDETASVIYGVYMHYLYTKNEKFLKENLQMCEKGIDFLKRYINDLFEKKENSEYKSKYPLSYDLWEMYEGVHLYSLASIYGAFDAILNMYKVLGKNVSDFEAGNTGNRLKNEKVAKSSKEIEALQTKLKKYINENLYDETKSCYVRNEEDKRMDISLLGAVVPFKVFTAKEKKVLNTVERINLSLRTYTGGYQRFENDHYMNGNPWVISNLWMTLYYLEKGEKKNAKETFDFVLKTAGRHYLLSEQIDNNTLKPNWVLGLGWSHAMFILVLEKMKQAGQV